MREFTASHIPKPLLAFQAPPGPLDLEIGAGGGLHAVRYCQQNPTRTLLAVEKTHTRFAKLENRKLGHPELRNLHTIHADAVAFVCHYLPTASLERIFLLYPNPYPKPKQANLRWHNRPFLGQLLKTLKPGGRLTLATNIQSYADEAAARMVDTWKLDLQEFRKVDPAAVPRTHFEKKYLARNETCWNLIFCKSASVAVQ